MSYNRMGCHMTYAKKIIAAKKVKYIICDDFWKMKKRVRSCAQKTTPN